MPTGYLLDSCRRFLPQKVCYCAPIDKGSKALMGLIMVLRLMAMIVGCFYGPYLYVVLPLGGLYLATDVLLLYSIFWTGNRRVDTKDQGEDGETHYSAEAEDDSCSFTTQRIWILTWLVLNTFAVVGLLTAVGLFANLGTWAMTHQPIHMVQFVTILVLVTLLVYAQVIVLTLYIILRDAWLVGICGPTLFAEESTGLTQGGHRVSTSKK